MLKVCDAFKASEESFALLQLLNNTERWNQEIDGNLLPAGEANTVLPRWMIPGRRGRAWSPDGLSCYNKILAAVRLDHCSEEGVMFETDLQNELSPGKP